MKNLRFILPLALISLGVCVYFASGSWGFLDSFVGFKSVSFRFTEIESGKPLANQKISLNRFAFDYNYETDDPELVISVVETDAAGMALFDLSKIKAGAYIFHCPGFRLGDFQFSPVASRLNLSEKFPGHIRVCRRPPAGGTIRGNSIYNFLSKKDIFIRVDKYVIIKDLRDVLIEM
jgi:hypothetical protein